MKKRVAEISFYIAVVMVLSACFQMFQGSVSADNCKHSFGTKYEANDDVHWRICTICGEKENMQFHLPGPAATETEPQICTICGYVLQEPLGHTHRFSSKYSYDETHHWYKCEGCDAIMGRESHTFDGKMCTICGYILPEQTTAPTTEPTTAPTTKPTTAPTTEPTAAPTATPTPYVTATPSPKITATPSPKITATPSPKITATPKPKITATPSPKVTATPDARETETPEPTPDSTPEPTETVIPTATATIVPVETMQVTRDPNATAIPITTPEQKYFTREPKSTAERKQGLEVRENEIPASTIVVIAVLALVLAGCVYLVFRQVKKK